MSVIAILAKCAAFSLLVRVPEEGLLLPFLFFPFQTKIHWEEELRREDFLTP